MLYYNVDEQGQPVTDLYGEVKCKKLTELSAASRWLSKGERWVPQQAPGPRRLDLQELSSLFSDGQPLGIEYAQTAANTGGALTDEVEDDASDAEYKVGQKRGAEATVN